MVQSSPPICLLKCSAIEGGTGLSEGKADLEVCAWRQVSAGALFTSSSASWDVVEGSHQGAEGLHMVDLPYCYQCQDDVPIAQCQPDGHTAYL